MNYRQKYYKYKSKYIESKLKTSQTGGVIYPDYSRFSDFNENTKSLVEQALHMNRYYYKYYNKYGILTVEGVDPADSIPMGTIIPEEYSEIGYETTLILNYLIEINNLLKKYNMKSDQSQPSYYVNDFSFSQPYLQLPFVLFICGLDAFPIIEKFVYHPLIENYYIFIDTYESDVLGYIFVIMRPYIQKGELIVTFDDGKFWNDIITIAKEVNAENIQLKALTENDPRLNKSKHWNIIGPNKTVMTIANKDKPNPYSKIPLSILDVRYDNNKDAFTKKLDS